MTTGSGLEFSAVALGLSHVHHMRSRRSRADLIAAAVDLGVSHLDTAPLYGDGLAELTIGRLPSSVRSRVTVTTKFGLYGSPWLGRLGYPAAPLWAARSILSRRGVGSWPRADLSVGALSRSLDRSLRNLRSDHVDVLAVHEPAGATRSQLEDIVAALEDFKRRGRIRFSGLAGADACTLAQELPGVFDVVQTGEADWSDSGVVPDLTYGIGATQGSSWDAKLLAARARRPSGAVIVGTTSVAHLAQTVKLATA